MRRVTAAEEAVTVSGVYLVEDRFKSSRDKRVFEEVEFSCSQALAIVEDSLDISINQSFQQCPVEMAQESVI